MLKIKKSIIRNVKFGKNCTIINPVNLYDCELGDNVFVGPFVEIQKGSKIGSNTRISSHSFICELVTIGKNCFIGHGVMFTNYLFKKPMEPKKEKRWLPTKIGNNVVIGSNSTLLPVKILNDAVIGAGSVVVKDIKKIGNYCGNPAKLIKKTY